MTLKRKKPLRERDRELIRLESFIKETIKLSNQDVLTGEKIRFKETKFSNLYRFRMLLAKMNLISKERNKETNFQYIYYIHSTLEKVLYEAMKEKEEYQIFLNRRMKMARARLISDEEVLLAISKLRETETTISESNLLKEIGKGSPNTIKKIIKDLLETDILKYSDYEKLGKTVKILNREYFESHKYQIQAKIEEEVYSNAESAAHARIREEVQNEFEQREQTIRSNYESKIETMQKDNQIRDLEKDLAFANEKVALLKEIIQSTRT